MKTRALLAALSLTLLWPAGGSWAQLASPNTTGVTMGHVHYYVQDVEAQKRFWTALGATPIKVGATDVMKFPEILIFLTRADANGTT